MAASKELEKINAQNDEKKEENEPKEKPKRVINLISASVLKRRSELEAEKLKAEKENEKSKSAF